MKKEKIYENLTPNTYIYLDELGNIIHQSEFSLVLGHIKDFRFYPNLNSKILLEQGLTVNMLLAIHNIIKKDAGIGVKKAEPLTEEDREQ